MKKKEIIHRLSRGIEEAPTDILQKLKEQEVTPMTEHDWITRQEEPTKNSRRWSLRPLIALATLLLLFLGGREWYNAEIESVLYMDINPSFEMDVDRKGRVQMLAGNNQEGKDLVENLNYKGKDTMDILKELMDKLILKGYLAEEHHAMLISVVNQDSTKSVEERQKIIQWIKDYLNQRKVSPVILSQSVHVGQSVEEMAARHDVSAGKMELIKKLMAANAGFTVDELAPLSISDLLYLLDEKDIDIRSYVEVDGDLTRYHKEEQEDDEDDLPETPEEQTPPTPVVTPSVKPPTTKPPVRTPVVDNKPTPQTTRDDDDDSEVDDDDDEIDDD